jgi:TRAP-type uncharacterized transport system fused permease subunit
MFASLTAGVGVVLLALGCVGYFTRPLGWPKRIWAFTAAGLLIMPPIAWLPAFTTDAVGLALGAAFLAIEWTAPARRRAPAASISVTPSTSIPRTKP